jgi:hypothetical protein
MHQPDLQLGQRGGEHLKLSSAVFSCSASDSSISGHTQ